MIALNFFSIFWSPGDLASASGGIVFMYGVVLVSGKTNPDL